MEYKEAVTENLIYTDEEVNKILLTDAGAWN